MNSQEEAVEEEAEAVEEAAVEEAAVEEAIQTQTNLCITMTRGMKPLTRQELLDNQRITQTITHVPYAGVLQIYSTALETRWTHSCKPLGCIEPSTTDISP
jgi:hypothetical protein